MQHLPGDRRQIRRNGRLHLIAQTTLPFSNTIKRYNTKHFSLTHKGLHGTFDSRIVITMNRGRI
jgi:hypothetical protein